MNRGLFIGLLLCAGLNSLAQVVTIKDQESYQPLEFVALASEKPSATALTDAEGQADISAFKGSERIQIRRIGYKTEMLSFQELQQGKFQVFLESSTISIDKAVVSATRWSQPSQKIPEKITTISAKEVAIQNPQTAADMLAVSGEVFIQKSQLGGGSPIIRGFATNRLLLAVDGVRMNTAIFRSGNLQNVISLDPFAVEHTEVMFGPGSVIYGSDAIGGVMNFYTLTPKFSTDNEPMISGQVVGRYASASNERTGHFHVNVGWKRWAMVTSFSHNDFDDLRMGRHGPEEYLRQTYVQRIDSVDRIFTNDDPLVQRPTGYQQTNLMQKVGFRPNEKWDLSYAFHYSTTTDYPRYDRLLRTRNGLPRSAEWYYGPQLWMMNQFAAIHTGKTKLHDEISLRIAWQQFEESRIDRDFNGIIRSRRVEEVDAYSANLDLHKTISVRHQLFYGVEAVFNDVNSIGLDENIITEITVPGPSRYPQATWASYAGYLTYQFRPTDKFTIQAGARYNHFTLDARFDTTFYPFPFTTAGLNKGALTGSLGFVYNPTESWVISANLSTGFRMPNVDDVGKVFDSEPGSVVVPNPDLKPEYAYNADVGVARVFGEFLKIDATAYYTWLNDALVRRNYTLDGRDSIVYNGQLSQVQAIQNAAIAYVWGIQAGFEARLGAGFGLSSRINYQKGEEELDDGSTDPLRHAAPWFGSSHLTYSAKRLKFDVYAIYNDEVSNDELATEEQNKDYLYATDKNGHPYSPGWYTLNFKALYQVTEDISVAAGIENLTDQRYRPYSSGIAGPGRNVILSLRAGF